MKKNIMAVYCLTVIGLFLFSGCKKENEIVNNVYNPVTNSAEYPVEVLFKNFTLDNPYINWKNLPYDGKVIIINSMEELENYIDGTLPISNIVDFSNTSMLLVSGASEHRDAYITKKLQQTSSHRYTLNIEIFFNTVTEYKNWVFAIRVDKLSEESVVDVRKTTYDSETDFYYLQNGEKRHLAIRKDYVGILCKSDADAEILQKEPFLLASWYLSQVKPFMMAVVNPLQTNIDFLLTRQEVVSAIYQMENFPYNPNIRRIEFPKNCIQVKFKEEIAPEFVFEKLGYTEQIDEVVYNPHLNFYTIQFKVALSEMLKISRVFYESGYCEYAVPEFVGGVLFH